MSVHVYAAGHCPDSHQPLRHVSRSTAEKWLLSGIYELIPGWNRRAIRIIPPEYRVIQKAWRQQHAQRLPPEELRGIYFQEPRSAAWREAHRMVRFPEKAPPAAPGKS